MALSKHYTSALGIGLPNSYWRIDNIVGDKNHLTLYVNVYADAAAAASGKRAVEAKEYVFAPTGEARWDKQGYIYLKSLAEFSDAGDA